MVGEGGVLAEGDDALERWGVGAPLDDFVVYLRLEGPLGHLHLHERRDAVHHSRDDPCGVRNRLQLVGVLDHPRPSECVGDIEEPLPSEHGLEIQVVPVGDALEIDADALGALQDRGHDLLALGGLGAPFDVDRVVGPLPRSLLLERVCDNLHVPVWKQEEHVALEEAALVAGDVEEVRVRVAPVHDGDDVHIRLGVIEDTANPVLGGHGRPAARGPQ